MIIGDYLKFSPYSYLAGIAVLLASHGYVYYKGYSHEHDKLVTYTAQVSLAQAQIEADIQRRLRESAAVNSDIATRLDVALRDLRKHPAVRVQRTDCNTRGLSPVPTTTGLAPQTPVVDPVDTAKLITAEECEKYLEDGIEDAVKYAWLQDFVIRQHEASK